eukprot:TRINITY_DN9960_c0_g1_i1.p1 TRINITY_DN9960_c0_g1~~TRINITY_DN9960_c0_g1_i1.p1  ORF type:complete len:796 (-),score=264.41 TRINITY_DN9960_c0_g1_i1:113-2500(-)
MEGRHPAMDIGPGLSNYEEPDSDEDMAELEAMLYSQIHYSNTQDTSCDQNASSFGAKAVEKTSDSFLVASYSEEGLEEEDRNEALGENDTTGYTTPGGDSGCGLSRPCSTISENYPPKNVIDSESEEDLIDSKVESRYFVPISNSEKPLVSNPFFLSDDGSDSESDDGIIVLPKREKTPPEIICLDSASCSPQPPLSSTIIISDNSGDEVPEERNSRKRTLNNSVLEISQEKHGNKNKNSRKNIGDTLKRSKKVDHYKADFGSDFEDNFGSDDSELDILSDVDESGLTLNLLGRYQDAQKKKLSEIFQQEVSKTKNAPSVELPSSWTKEMDAFYNEVDEKYLDIELEDIFAEMPPNSHWPVDRADVYSGGYQRPRYFQGKRCNNCNQFGHLARDCSEPFKIPRCPMCGKPGHAETRCPEKSCLRCGQPGFGFLESCMHCRRLNDTECTECAYYGHIARDCPDLWRRFHATTAGTKVAAPKAGHADKLEKQCWCCNCGRKGHVLDNCKSYSYSKYPPTTLRVVRYKQPKVSEFEDYIPSQSKKARREEKLLKRKHEKKLLRKNQTCPNSPAIFEAASFNSEPASPGQDVRENAFPTSLLVENAIKKLETCKGKSKKKDKKAQKKQLIVEELERGKSKKEVLAEILNSSKFGREDFDSGKMDKKKQKKIKGMKSLIKACNEHKNFREDRKNFREDRMKEWKESRGFGKKEPKDFPRNVENKTSRAALIPTEIKAAWKFLKKEVQKHDAATFSAMGKKIKKDLKQEIFGLKNLHNAPLLKKVERKRLADLVLELRKST